MIERRGGRLSTISLCLVLKSSYFNPCLLFVFGLPVQITPTLKDMEENRNAA